MHFKCIYGGGGGGEHGQKLTKALITSRLSQHFTGSYKKECSIKEATTFILANLEDATEEPKIKSNSIK